MLCYEVCIIKLHYYDYFQVLHWYWNYTKLIWVNFTQFEFVTATEK